MMDHKTKKNGKARIPDHLRRRALVSCDRCKKRRIRCMRSSGSDANEPCQSCLEVGVNCESTLPRKTRIYGSVETLSLRYRVLDALIKGLYPYKDTNSIDVLYEIAETHDITLPHFSDQTVSDEVFSQPHVKHESPPQSGLGTSSRARSPSTTSKDSDHLASVDSQGAPVVEEKLVPLPRGPSHYIGPSSSFGFVLTVRNMVAEFNAALRNIQPDDERSKISSEFAGSQWSKALEPITKDEDDESSEDYSSTAGESVHGGGRVSNRGFSRPPLFSPTTSSAMVNRSKKTTLLSLLPSREVTDTFTEAYFEKVHPNYLLFHRNTFQIRYENMFANPGLLVRDEEPGWICCIFMMLVFGAQALEDRDKKQSVQIQRHYLDLVQKRLHQLVSVSTLVNVQALLLLQLYQHNCTERNSAFMLLGCASRMAMALGMHREGTSGGFDNMEREVRKRVWWTTYTFEQSQCAILGRPCAIDDTEVNISFPYEMMLDGGDSLPPNYVEYSVRLAKLMSDTRRKIYASQYAPTVQGDSPRIPLAIQVLLDLDSWAHSLPPCLRLESLSQQPKHRRAVLLLHTQFHHTQALVTRPFILRKVSVQLARKLGRHVRSQDLDAEEMRLSNACAVFSLKSVKLVHQLMTDGIFDGVSWLDAYYIYQSVFILSLDFLARPWDDQDTPEDVTRKRAVREVMDTLQSHKLCPTFTVLTQVSLQLAKIVGIFDPPPNPNLPNQNQNQSHSTHNQEYHQYPPHPSHPIQNQAQTQNRLPLFSHQQPSHIPTPQPLTQHPNQHISPSQVPHAQTQHHLQQVPYSFNQIQGSQTNVENVVTSWFQREQVELPWDMKDFFGVDGYVGNGPPGFPDPQSLTLGGTYVNHLPGVTDEEELLGSVQGTAYTQWGAIDTPFARGPGAAVAPEVQSISPRSDNSGISGGGGGIGVGHVSGNVNAGADGRGTYGKMGR